MDMMVAHLCVVPVLDILSSNLLCYVNLVPKHCSMSDGLLPGFVWDIIWILKNKSNFEFYGLTIYLDDI